MYIRREIESTVDRMLGQGKVVLVTGARQVGKTTALKQHLCPTFSYVTMENPQALLQAKNDALLFFNNYDLPLIIDEVQHVPELFSAVKFVVDQSNEKGQIILTGSQTYHLMKGVSESLAGRIRILEMSGLSLRELSGNAESPHPFIPKKFRTQDTDASTTESNIWETIHRGSMPELQDENLEWESFYADYMRAYIERDVRDLVNLRNEMKFYSFVVACAARTGQLLNATDIGNAIDADSKTVKSWMSVLQASGLIRIVEPFWPNVNKRLTKTPKIFFMDTGLVCYLTRWTTPDQLRNGAAAGSIFETFAVSEIIKSHMNAGSDLRNIWFYRDSKKREIDLVIQNGHTLHPVEIKTGMQVKQDAAKHFTCLDSLSDYERGFGAVVCQTKTPYLLTPEVQAVSLQAI